MVHSLGTKCFSIICRLPLEAPPHTITFHYSPIPSTPKVVPPPECRAGPEVLSWPSAYYFHYLECLPPSSDSKGSLWITQIACFFHRRSPSLNSLNQVLSSRGAACSLCSHSSWAKTGPQVCLPIRYWNPQKRNLTIVVSILPCVTWSLWVLFHFEEWMNIVSILSWFFKMLFICVQDLIMKIFYNSPKKLKISWIPTSYLDSATLHCLEILF